MTALPDALKELKQLCTEQAFEIAHLKAQLQHARVL
jgi:hypothetical protein